MSYYDPAFAPPPYNDLDAANFEINRLREELFNERNVWTKRLMKLELTKRSLVGTIRDLEAQLKALKGTP